MLFSAQNITCEVAYIWLLAFKSTSIEQCRGGWQREGNSVANKGEYIRKDYALRKSLKGMKYKLVQETEKKTECFAKFIKRVRRGLKNIQLKFIVCVSYESDLQLNYTR